MTSMTRGPLSPQVYWRRRIIVLGLALLLVFGIAKVLGGGSDATDKASDTAQLADADTSPAPVEPTTAATVAPSAKPKPSVKPKPTPTPTPTPAVPVGWCADSDIAVTPEVTKAVAGPGNGATIALSLRTVRAEACTWRIRPASLTLKVTSGRDNIWSSQQCRRAIPTQDVVVRRAETTVVQVAWNARRSDEECSRLTKWALPGWYHVSAAALSGEPAASQFELEAPTAANTAPSPAAQPSAAAPATPDQTKNKQKNKNKHKQKQKNKPSQAPTHTPSGAVEPNG